MSNIYKVICKKEFNCYGNTRMVIYLYGTLTAEETCFQNFKVIM